MAKKEIKNGLVEEAVETTVETTQDAPTQKVELEKATEELVSPGHATRAFRG
jgi:hypothetical protein